MGAIRNIRGKGVEREGSADDVLEWEGVGSMGKRDGNVRTEAGDSRCLPMVERR